MTSELSIVLPCYNEAGNISNILNRFAALREKCDFELILVDNGSTDNTPEILNRELAGPGNNFAHSVRVPVNIGYGHGLKTGLESAKAEILAVSHADLQCPPEDVITALDLFKRENGRCLIKGRRRDRRPFLDRIVTWFYNRLSYLLLNIKTDGNNVVDINAEPKMFARSLMKRVKDAPNDFTFDLFVLHSAVRAGMPIKEFETAYELRAWGKSKLAANPWTRLKTALRAFSMILELK